MSQCNVRRAIIIARKKFYSRQFYQQNLNKCNFIYISDYLMQMLRGPRLLPVIQRNKPEMSWSRMLSFDQDHYYVIYIGVPIGQQYIIMKPISNQPIEFISHISHEPCLVYQIALSDCARCQQNK